GAGEDGGGDRVAEGAAGRSRVGEAGFGDRQAGRRDRERGPFGDRVAVGRHFGGMAGTDGGDDVADAVGDGDVGADFATVAEGGDGAGEQAGGADRAGRYGGAAPRAPRAGAGGEGEGQRRHGQDRAVGDADAG